MTKPGSRKRDETIDDAVNELGAIAAQDRSVRRERRAAPAGDRDALEAEALPAQREAYDRAMGRKTRRPPIETTPIPRRERMAQHDEERDWGEEEEPATVNASEEDDHGPETEETDLETEPEGEESEADSPRRSRMSLSKADNALRRIHAPDWVFALEPDRRAELASQLLGHQENADRALTSKDETIRALTAALAGTGTRAHAAEENSESPATHSERDLEEAASAVARGMGLESDETVTKALVEYGRKVRGKSGGEAEGQLRELQKTMRTMILDQGVRGLRRTYPELRADKDAVARFKSRVERQARTGDYDDGDTSRLFRDAAMLEFGPPRKTSSGTASRRAASAPVTRERHQRRTKAVLQEGTEDHDRAVMADINRRNRQGFATRR